MTIITDTPSGNSAIDDNTVSAKSGSPAQSEMPLAIVHGQAVTDLPTDLYIPPDALEIILDAFEGPLDLLLYLIRRQNLDILEINVAEVTQQYIVYVEMMDALKFELAAEYLVMAAMLAEIKSGSLLPRNTEAEEMEEDPRAALIRRLQEYERFKQAAEDIDRLPRMDRDTYPVSVESPNQQSVGNYPQVDLKEILLVFAKVLRRAALFEHHQVQKEPLSTRERMARVLEVLGKTNAFVPFVSLFTFDEGRRGVIVTFMAIMELIKESLVDMVQNEAFGPIHIKAHTG